MKSLVRLVVYVPLLSAVMLWLFVVVNFSRDDTTGTVRQIVSRQLGVSYEEADSHTTLGDLNADELDVVELIMELEDSFSIIILDDDFKTLGPRNDWEKTTVLDLAEIVRSKRQLK